MRLTWRYCGRDFSEADIEAIASLAASLPTRKAVADAVCDALRWYRPDGRRKDMSCRVALIRMEADGLIRLPPPLNGNGNGALPRHIDPPASQGLSISSSLADLGLVELQVVDTKAASRTWREMVASYHYLGYVAFAGAQLRYLVSCSSGLLGALGFAASAWKCAPRDEHIGWDRATREARLHLVVGNARFLILPQVRVPNLASFVLGAACRRLASDWQAAYGYSPVLLETFVERERFDGASYKAANWVHVGVTKGRGKLDRHRQANLPVKDVYLYPLRRDYRRILTAPA